MHTKTINAEEKARVERVRELHRDRIREVKASDEAAYYEALDGDLTVFAEADGVFDLIDAPTEEESRGKVVQFEPNDRSIWLQGNFTLVQLRGLLEHAEKHCAAFEDEWAKQPKPYG